MAEPSRGLFRAHGTDRTERSRQIDSNSAIHGFVDSIYSRQWIVHDCDSREIRCERDAIGNRLGVAARVNALCEARLRLAVGVQARSGRLLVHSAALDCGATALCVERIDL